MQIKSEFPLIMTTPELNYFFLAVMVINKSGPIICDKCGSKYKNRFSFSNHFRQFHQMGSHFCDLCPRSFCQKSLILQHIERDHLWLRRFECKFCKQRSYSKKTIKVHEQRHLLEVVCKLCNKTVTNMEKHMKSHAKAKCSSCSKDIPRKSLNRHMKVHTKP